MDNISSDIYKEYILSIYSNLSNKREINTKTVSFEYNPLCGDKILIFLFVENDTIKDASFSGDGCILSQVSAEILTESIKGMTIMEAKEINLEYILKKLDLENLISPSRLKCIEVAINALRKI